MQIDRLIHEHRIEARLRSYIILIEYRLYRLVLMVEFSVLLFKICLLLISVVVVGFKLCVLGVKLGDLSIEGSNLALLGIELEVEVDNNV